MASQIALDLPDNLMNWEKVISKLKKCSINRLSFELIMKKKLKKNFCCKIWVTINASKT